MFAIIVGSPFDLVRAVFTESLLSSFSPNTRGAEAAILRILGFAALPPPPAPSKRIILQKLQTRPTISTSIIDQFKLDLCAAVPVETASQGSVCSLHTIGADGPSCWSWSCASTPYLTGGAARLEGRGEIREGVVPSSR